MAHITQLPLEVVRMILQELYTVYCREGNMAWSFSDAMKVHPIWQAIGNDIIYEEIGRIVKQRTMMNGGVQMQCQAQQKLQHQSNSFSDELQRHSTFQRNIY